MQHTIETRESEHRAENINQIGGNISLTTNKGDIALNGVNLQGGKVAIKSAGNLTQTAAKSSSTSSESVTTHTSGLTGSIGAAPTGVGMGVSAGASGSYDETTTKTTSYTNGMISGTDISIETAGDHNLIGSNIKGNSVSAKIGGNQNITSVQDTSEMEHTRGNWSASVGVAVTTDGLVQGTASASGSGGQDFDRSKLTAEQAGISGDTLDLKVAGNLNLTGAHITSKPGQGSVDVGGKITAQTLQDSREKDGGYAGGGGGISKNGLPSVTLEFGRVDQVHYTAENAATIDIGDPSKVSAAGGISGNLNTNADKQLTVLQNKRVAGTDVKVEISIGDAQEIKAGVKKLFTPKAGRSVHIADAPKTQPRQSDSGPTRVVQADAPQTAPRRFVDIDAPKVKQAFDQRVVVNTDPTNPVVNQAAQSLANKHADNTVVIAPTADGGHKVLSGALTDSGSKKVEVVGHSDGLKLGGLDAKKITDVVQKLTNDGNSTVDKVALVGCGTACANDGPSLVSEVSGLLQQQGAATKVKGYDTPVMVDSQGQKLPTLDSAPDALGKLYVGTTAPYTKPSLKPDTPDLPLINISKAVLHERNPSTGNGNAPANSSMQNVPDAHTVVKPIASEAVNTAKTALPVGESAEYRPTLPPPKGPKTEVDNYLLVNLQPDDAIINKSLSLKLNRHPDNTVLAHVTPDGGVQFDGDGASLLGKKVAYKLSGHGNIDGDPTIGGLDHLGVKDLLDKIKTIAPDHQLVKLTLAGCKTNCEANSLTKLVQSSLLGSGIEVPVKGYDASVTTQPDGKELRAVTEKIEPALELTDSWVNRTDVASKNEGNFYTSPDGDPWLLRPVADENYRRATNEQFVAKLYGFTNDQNAGKTLIWDKANDKIFMAEPYTKDFTRPLADAMATASGLTAGLGMDLWLGNWGVLTDKTNAAGEPVFTRTTDQSLEYWAGNQYERNAISYSVEAQLKNMVNPAVGERAKIFANMSNSDKAESIMKVLAYFNDDAEVCAICNAVGPGTFEERKELAKTLLSRRDELEDAYVNIKVDMRLEAASSQKTDTQP